VLELKFNLLRNSKQKCSAQSFHVCVVSIIWEDKILQAKVLKAKRKNGSVFNLFFHTICCGGVVHNI
jgi:hypothetical protein